MSHKSTNCKLVQFCFLLMLPFYLAACAVVVPVHEAEPPEVLGNWGFRFGIFEGVSPLVAPVDLSATGNTKDEAAVFGYRLDFGFLDRFQVNFDFFGGSSGAAGDSIALKYQWTGDSYFHAKAGNNSQTSTFRLWSGAAADVSLNYNGQELAFDHSQLTGNGFDISHVWGHRWFDAFGVYGGPKYISGNVTAQYREVENGPIINKSNRDFWGAGGLGGFFWSPGGRHVGFDLVLELEAMDLPNTYSTGRAVYTTLMMTLAIPFSFSSDSGSVAPSSAPKAAVPSTRPLLTSGL